MTNELTLKREGKLIDPGKFCDFLAALHNAMDAQFFLTYCLFWRSQSNEYIEYIFKSLNPLAWTIWDKFESGGSISSLDVEPLRKRALT